MTLYYLANVGYWHVLLHITNIW